MQAAAWLLLLPDGLFDWLQSIWLWIVAILAVILALCIFCVCGVVCVCGACSRYCKGRRTSSAVHAKAEASLSGQSLIDSSVQAVSDEHAERRRKAAALLA